MGYYINVLNESGIRLNSKEDKLTWPENKRFGVITTKLAYDFITKRKKIGGGLINYGN